MIILKHLAVTWIYTLSLHDALPIFEGVALEQQAGVLVEDLEVAVVRELAADEVLDDVGGAGGGLQQPVFGEDAYEVEVGCDVVWRQLGDSDGVLVDLDGAAGGGVVG